MLNRKVSWSGLRFKTIILAPALRRAGRDRSGGCCNERLVAWAGVTTVIGERSGQTFSRWNLKADWTKARGKERDQGRLQSCPPEHPGGSDCHEVS